MPPLPVPPPPLSLSPPAPRASRLGSLLGSGLAAAATFLVVALLVVVVGHLVWTGRSAFSWRFLTAGGSGVGQDPAAAGILPMLIGTVARVLLMTLVVMPAGVLTAVYLHEYAGHRSGFSRMIRRAVNTLASVPSILFGLFGLGFFVVFVGGSVDDLLAATGAEPRWGRPCLLWASCTLAVMTLPVVIVSTDEALRAIPPGLREASFALGATRMQTVLRVALPEALPGILTGAILAISRAAGEVAPILFTGAAYYMARLPRSLNEQFMDLGYHAYILATQTPNPEVTRPILYATVTVLLILTLALNAVGMLIRMRVRRALAAARA
jgi:phosphate transport system permease protein